ncbi:hypothetical protein [Actinoplanes sp. NPDC051851]|uniref:hypothetical protein n=1 Tax=Actinoplanes sp. NPDC051851 TaxID=3154753 RepID=UPI0034324D5D
MSRKYLDWPITRFTDVYAAAVLTAVDADGAPLLVRTTITAGAAGYRVAVPEGVPVAAGPAALLVHRHDDALASLHNANVRGVLEHDGVSRLLRPSRLVGPAGGRKPGRLEPLRLAREMRVTARRYLERRDLARPAVPWDAYRAIRAAVPKN